MDKKVYGLIGRKLSHSYSVPIHRELKNPDYELFELEPEQLCDFFADPNIAGINVTIPYKHTVLEYCDVVSPVSAELGSVNTIIRRADGRLYGYNTDTYGFEYMARRAGISFEGRKVLVFGSGGASATVQSVAKKLGAAVAVVISRNGADNYQNLSKHYDADLLINATPLGMYPQNHGCAADPALFPNCAGALDLVYNPLRTVFLQKAEALGIPTANGLDMLVAQAKMSEELFFDRKIPDGEIARIGDKLRREMENIVLIGMPGCGKSTVGGLLAAITSRPVIDLDAKIEEAAGRTILEIFKTDGEAVFRRLEAEQVALAGKERGAIIVTGGGVVKSVENYRHLHQNGRIYHLVRDTALLDLRGRPLSRVEDMERMYKQRLPLYEAFRDAAVDNNRAAADTAEAIWRQFCGGEENKRESQ
ncbi:MAG: shikimate kinase [Clostridia bacterium]|nr:shikimate kinase [Clostridia bacterium]